MVLVRRIYLLFIAAASLGMVISGLASIGGTLIEWALSPAAIETSFRQTLAGSIAFALVGLPIWALHWSIAQRLARRDPAERSAAFRRLYLYGVVAALLICTGVFSARALDEALRLLLRDADADLVRLLRAIWQLVLSFTFWGMHMLYVAKDRRELGEEGASATVRRWYAYAAQVVALVVLLFGGRELLTIVGMQLIEHSGVELRHVTAVVARVLTSLAIWLFHRRWTADPRIMEDDRRSTLRAVAGFGILALSVAMSISYASRALYYGLARLLGVDRPGGQQGSIPELLVGPVATIVVFGAAWVFARRSLVADAAEAEAPRQAGVRRLYTHLVALVALVSFTTGVGGILWTLADIASDASSMNAASHRDQMSLFLTLIIVGLPMWLAHWRPAPAPSERRAFSRRLYLFAALLVAVLSLLASGAYTVQQVLAVLLGAGPASPWTDIEHAASVSVVALAVALYHWKTLRGDGAERAVQERTAEVVASAPPLLVEITGATEADVAHALESLPSTATYTFR